MNPPVSQMVSAVTIKLTIVLMNSVDFDRMFGDSYDKS